MKFKLMLSPNPVLNVIVPVASLRPPPNLSLSDDHRFKVMMQKLKTLKAFQN